jgi:SAM-dependent methyltransferase
MSSAPEAPRWKPEDAVRARYSAAAQLRDAALCCPVDYDARYLEVIPDEVLERDYGCGDPSRYVRAGDAVLDLGSGGGKICFIAAQIVGPKGLVIGVDVNPEMLDLARGAAPRVAERVGYANVELRRGQIQDLALDLEIPGPAKTIWDLDDLSELTGRPIATASHCFGCTAGAGSGCGGTLA